MEIKYLQNIWSDYSDNLPHSTEESKILEIVQKKHHSSLFRIKAKAIYGLILTLLFPLFFYWYFVKNLTGFLYYIEVALTIVVFGAYLVLQIIYVKKVFNLNFRKNIADLYKNLLELKKFILNLNSYKGIFLYLGLTLLVILSFYQQLTEKFNHLILILLILSIVGIWLYIVYKRKQFVKKELDNIIIEMKEIN